jgi:hypothetical protein
MPTTTVITLQFVSQRLKLRSLRQRWSWIDHFVKTRKRETLGTLGDRLVFAEARYARIIRLCQSTFLQRQFPVNLTHHSSTAVESVSLTSQPAFDSCSTRKELRQRVQHASLWAKLLTETDSAKPVHNEADGRPDNPEVYKYRLLAQSTAGSNTTWLGHTEENLQYTESSSALLQQTMISSSTLDFFELFSVLTWTEHIMIVQGIQVFLRDWCVAPFQSVPARQNAEPLLGLDVDR